MNYFLGVDAGGTKTCAVVIDDKSTILAESLGGPANYHNLGLVQATKNVATAVAQTLLTAHLTSSQINWCTIGIASCDTQKDRERLFNAFSTANLTDLANKLTVVNDTEVGLYSGTLPPALVVVCGTGCNVYGKNAHGEGATAGNWGHFLGDKGSGYQLAKRMFEVVIEEFDGRGSPTKLTQRIVDRLKINSAKDILDWHNDTQPSVREISDLAPLVIQTAEEGDEVSKELVDKTVKELARALTAVVKRLKMEDEALRIVTVGGLFESKYFRALFEGHVTALFRHVRLIKPLVPPAVGAAIMAKNEWEKPQKLT